MHSLTRIGPRGVCPLLALMVAWLSGCADQPDLTATNSTDEARTQPQISALRSGPLSDQPLSVQPLSADLERSLKATEAPAVRARAPVSSEAAHALRANAPQLPDDLRQALNALPAPMLIPRAPALFERTTLSQGPGWATLALHGDGLHVTVHGSRLTLDHPHLAREFLSHPKFDPDEVQISVAHRIWSAAFKRWGIAWLIDVECADPHSDARCADEAWLRDLVDHLDLVGGEP